MRADSDSSRPSRVPARAVVALIAVLVAVGVGLLASAGAPAESLQKRLDAKQSKLSKVKDRKQVLTTTISQYNDRIDTLQSQVTALESREEVLKNQLAVKQAQLKRAIAQLGVAKHHLTVIRAHLKRALIVLRNRMVAIYEQGSPDLVGVIVSSKGFNQLVDRAGYLQSIQQQDTAVITRVRSLRNEAKNTVERLRTAKKRIKAARDSIAAQEQAIATARAAVQNRKTDLVGARSVREQALQQVKDSEQKLEGSVADIQQKIQAQIAASEGHLPVGPVPSPSAAGFIWPVNGLIASPFGWRFGGTEMHPGIDIAVPTGTPIRAAAAGTVIFTESEAESGGYGNFTCIDHGGGLSTCYAHQEQFSVSPGQHVDQGQVIGYSDCTGYCFGPHVHFEVRVNGTPVDPMGYL